MSDTIFKSTCESVFSKLVPHDQSTIDLILTYDKPQHPTITLPDGRKFLWYLAIGSMMNPVLLYLRELTPITSYPTRCSDYKLVFRGMAGMADTEACAGSKFHGIVHLLSQEQMARLVALELTYQRIVVNSINYQKQSQLVYVYQMSMINGPSNPPSERYLDVIVKGGEHFKVHQGYLDQLREQQDVIPRRQPHLFQSFGDVPTDVFYSEEELAKHNGSDPSLPMWISVNGKVLEYDGLSSEDDPNYEAQKRTFTFVKSRFAGREVVPLMARYLYEPMYNLVSSDNDICEQQRAEIEDDVYGKLCSDSNKKNWKLIGRLRLSNNSSFSFLLLI